MIRLKGGQTAIGQLLAIHDVVEQIIESDEFHGCIFVNAAMEFPLPHDPAHILASRNKQAIEDIVFDLAKQAGAEDPKLLARQLCLIMEGAYVTRHVTGNTDTIDVARSIADLMIHTQCPQTEPSPENVAEPDIP